jgi:hypothetical protein
LQNSLAHRITFCGEEVPIDNEFVANKLMNVIRKQTPNVNLPQLRANYLKYKSTVEHYLAKHKIPDDFKYLPIVESGFAIRTSGVGAHGFWQFMPETAKGYGLVMNATIDEREDINKSSDAACRMLKDYYMMIFKRHKLSSWVFTAAAYNFGIGNILKSIQNKGKDYFTMQLNPETAVYVYKIIAVKELFEYPELYIKNFGYNIFNSTATAKSYAGRGDDDESFTKISFKKQDKKDNTKTVWVSARIAGKNKDYKKFNDGDLVAVELQEDLKMMGSFLKKGATIKGQGWIIDGRIHVDLYGGHDVLLYDQNNVKGLDPSQLKKGEPILLLNNVADDESQW